jgi:hypothetical protein
MLPPETDSRATVDIHILKIWKDHVPDPKKPGEFKEVHKVEWAKRGTREATVERVDRLKKMPQLWERIEPAYDRWMRGRRRRPKARLWRHGPV